MDFIITHSPVDEIGNSWTLRIANNLRTRDIIYDWRVFLFTSKL